MRRYCVNGKQIFKEVTIVQLKNFEETFEFKYSLAIEEKSHRPTGLDRKLELHRSINNNKK